MYNSILKGLKLKKDILATYRKRAINARFLSLADNNKNINVGQEEWTNLQTGCRQPRKK